MTENVTVDAKPEFYDVARPKDVDEQLRKDLGRYIIPSAHNFAPVTLNIFLEAKAPKGDNDVVKRQTCYDGDLGARTMHSLQTYRQDKPVYDSNAYTTTSTYHNGNLKIYTTHPTMADGPEAMPQYRVTHLRGWDLTDSPKSFR